jgi:ribosomal-protein-alanine N-acetyltransferase
VVVNTLALRPMTSADLDLVHAMEVATFTSPWPRSFFEDELAADNRNYLVAEEGSELIGYGGIMLIEGDAHVMTVAVAADRRTRGIGSRIMVALVDAAIAAGALHLTLEVRPSNRAARRLYQRFGFEPVGLRPRYYPDEDALVMWALDITEPEYRGRIDAIREAVS